MHYVLSCLSEEATLSTIINSSSTGGLLHKNLPFHFVFDFITVQFLTMKQHVYLTEKNSIQSNSWRWRTVPNIISRCLVVQLDIVKCRAECCYQNHTEITSFILLQARKILRHLKGTLKLRTSTLNSSVSKQASATLRHLHAWSRIQSEIRAHRISMATEARIRQKNLENQMKLDAKLHDLEVRPSRILNICSQCPKN